MRDTDTMTPHTNQVVPTFQKRVAVWMQKCFGAAISSDMTERCHRFFEEATEKVQAHGMTRSECHQLVDYTFNRPIGEPAQETGGTMVTLAALDSAAGIDMHQAAETELARIDHPETILKIRAKQAAKPKHSPLPEASVSKLAGGWISVDDALPPYLEGKEYSANVLGVYTGYKGKKYIGVFNRAVIEYTEDGHLWAWAKMHSCFGDLHSSDCEFDDDYTITLWQPIPSVSQDQEE